MPDARPGGIRCPEGGSRQRETCEDQNFGSPLEVLPREGDKSTALASCHCLNGDVGLHKETFFGCSKTCSTRSATAAPFRQKASAFYKRGANACRNGSPSTKPQTCYISERYHAEMAPGPQSVRRASVGALLRRRPMTQTEPAKSSQEATVSAAFGRRPHPSQPADCTPASCTEPSGLVS